MCGEVPSLPVSWSGDDPLLPPVYIKYVLKHGLSNSFWSALLNQNNSGLRQTFHSMFKGQRFGFW
jgi:hypothetical protein